jgi:EpsI family protein
VPPSTFATVASALAALVVVALPVAGRTVLETGAVAAAPAITLPERLPGGWRAVPATTSYAPVFEGPTLELRGAYTANGRTVHVFLAYYSAQRYRQKLITSENMLVRSSDTHWSLVRTGQRTVAGGEAWRTAEIVAGNPLDERTEGARLDLQQIYWVDGGWHAGQAETAVRSALGRLAGRGDRAASLVVWTEGRDAALTAATLDDFTAAGLDTFHRLLNEAPGR